MCKCGRSKQVQPMRPHQSMCCQHAQIMLNPSNRCAPNGYRTRGFSVLGLAAMNIH